MTLDLDIGFLKIVNDADHADLTWLGREDDIYDFVPNIHLALPNDVKAWLQENDINLELRIIAPIYDIHGNRDHKLEADSICMYFESDADAILFKLRWL